MPFPIRSGAWQAGPRGLLVALWLSCTIPTLTASEHATGGTRTSERNIAATLDPAARDERPSTANRQVKNAALEESNGAGNLLWAVPLTSLFASQQRPIFSASRRPRLIAKAVPIQTAPPPPIAQPRVPLLSLVGVIASEVNSIAILVDETTKAIIRLKAGESHSGWTLSRVERREVTLEKDQRTAILSLPNRSTK